MRKIWNISFHAVAIPSSALLVLCVIGAVNYLCCDDVKYELPFHQTGGPGRMVYIEHGSLTYLIRQELTPPPEGTTLKWIRTLPFTKREWHGFAIGWGENVPRVNLFMEGRPNFAVHYQRVKFISVPLWAMIALLSILPALAVRRLLRWRRVKRWQVNGCCSACGYDLRCSRDRCPECGQPISVW